MDQAGTSQHDDVVDSRRWRPGERLVAVKKRVRASGNSISFMCKDNRIGATLSQRHKLRAICANLPRAEVIFGNGQATTERKAWLDVRQINSHPNPPSFRQYNNPLTARDLYTSLNEQLFDHESKPDAHRVLIYVEDLDRKHTNTAHFIHALAETVFFSHAPTLLKTVCHHLFDFCPTIKLERTYGPTAPTYEFLVHMPHFTVYFPEPQAESSEPQVDPSDSQDEPPEHLEKLSIPFLDPEPQDAQGIQYPQIYKVHSTFAICGRDFKHYFVNGFADSHPNNQRLVDREFHYATAESSEEIHEDPIAGDGFGGVSIDVNDPILDAREYGLHLLYNRIKTVTTEWKNVVDALLDHYTIYQKSVSQPLESKTSEGTHNKDDVKAADNRTRQWRELVRELLDCLKRTRRTLEVFLAPESELWTFFRASEPSQINFDHEIKALRHNVEDLRNAEITLDLWMRTFNENTQNLQLLSTRRGNEDNRNNGIMTKGTVTLITPIALTIGLASVNEKAIPYEMSFKSLLVTLVVFFGIVQLIVHPIGLYLEDSGIFKNFQFLRFSILSLRAMRTSVQAADLEHTTYPRVESDQSEGEEVSEPQSPQRALLMVRSPDGLEEQLDSP